MHTHHFMFLCICCQFPLPNICVGSDSEVMSPNALDTVTQVLGKCLAMCLFKRDNVNTHNVAHLRYCKAARSRQRIEGREWKEVL